MPLVRVTDHFRQIVEQALTECMSPDQNVYYEVWITDFMSSCGAEDCEGVHTTELLNVLMSMDVPNEERPDHPHAAKANWDIDLTSAIRHPDEIAAQVKECWSEMVFTGTAYGLSALDEQLDALVEGHEQ